MTQAQIISEIQVEGNTKTRREIITQEMLLKVGDKLDQKALEVSRQAIMDLGLFRKVKIVEEPLEGKFRLLVRVTEKEHDWYILPRIDRNADGDITLGVNWRANNLNGLNQSTGLTVSHKNFDDATTDEEYRIKWNFSYPRIVGTQYSGFSYINLSQASLDERRDGLEGSYDQSEYVFGLGLGKWFSKSGLSRGLHGSLGIELQRYEFDYIKGEPGLYDDVMEVALTGELSYRNVRDLLYSRRGYSLGMVLKQASELLGSDRPYFHQHAWYRQYLALPWHEHANFNYQVQLASGDNSIFGDPIYELSGRHTLRGYSRETLEGDAYFLVNTELLTPIFGQRALRGGVLFDFGNAYESFSEITDSGLEAGVGLSLRWVLKQWVDTEIRLDVAQGLGDDGETKVYVAANSFF